MTLINDGHSGESAGVDKKNRLSIAGQADSADKIASIEGRAFNVNTGVINLTSANGSAIIYVSNTTDHDLVLSHIHFHLGASTNGVGETKYVGYINPTGTITSGTDISVVNLNLGSQVSKPFDSTAKKGAEATTASSVFGTVEGLLPQPGYYEIKSNLTLPKGVGASTTIYPPTGNTSMNIVIEYICYYVDTNTGN